MVGPSHSCRESAFSNIVLLVLFNISELVLRPFCFCLTRFAGPFIPTTAEKLNPNLLWRQRCLIAPIYAIGVVALLLPWSVAFCLRIILNQFRRPYCISIKETRLEVEDMPSKLDETDASGVVGQVNASFSVVTSNVCLLPELAAKINNLDDTENRVRKIGERIIVDQAYYTNMMQTYTKGRLDSKFAGGDNTRVTTRSMSKSSPTKEDIVPNYDSSDPVVNILTHFTRTDFFCLQETFERNFAKLLITELHKVYPWVAYDAGHCTWKLNSYGLNSGLMIASRYEFMEVRFKPFTAKCALGIFICQGLLMVKVNLGQNSADRNIKNVGYIFNTHLQAFQGDKPIIAEQLSDVVLWTEEFRNDTSLPDEKIVFDVLCGDFNIDNMSPGETHLTKHELFSIYTDVCRERPGRDHDWTVGTELRPAALYDEAIQTPEGLKAVLEDPYLRQQYILDADLESATMEAIFNSPVKKDEHGNIILTPVGGRRRIDYVLYRKSCPVIAHNYNFVTRLASLTDHIPVSMTFGCKNW